jgi:hypothetical protein
MINIDDVEINMDCDDSDEKIVDAIEKRIYKWLKTIESYYELERVPKHTILALLTKDQILRVTSKKIYLWLEWEDNGETKKLTVS